MHPGPPAPRLCSQVILVSWGMAVWSHRPRPQRTLITIEGPAVPAMSTPVQPNPADYARAASRARSTRGHLLLHDHEPRVEANRVLI